MEKLEFLCTDDRNMKWCNHCQNNLAIFLKLNIHRPCNPAILFLGTFSKETKMHVHRQIAYKCPQQLFFVLAKSWNNPNVQQQVNGLINCSISIQQNTSSIKGMNYHYTQYHYAKFKKPSKTSRYLGSSSNSTWLWKAEQVT